MKRKIMFNILPDSDVVVYPTDSVKLFKKPNMHDEESIEVWLLPRDAKIDDLEPPLSTRLGYVANSTQTVPLGTYSAGRLVDKIEDGHEGFLMITSNDHVRLLIGGVHIDGTN